MLNAKIGDYFTIVRQERGTQNWYLGSITDENARDFTIDLDFLSKGKTYEATIYADGEGAEWKTNPYPVEIKTKKVTSEDKLDIKLAAGGGQAVIFRVIE